jgi:hypothetical protein
LRPSGVLPFSGALGTLDSFVNTTRLVALPPAGLADAELHRVVGIEDDALADLADRQRWPVATAGHVGRLRTSFDGRLFTGRRRAFGAPRRLFGEVSLVTGRVGTIRQHIKPSVERGI